jgi:hypothetical protein
MGRLSTFHQSANHCAGRVVGRAGAPLETENFCWHYKALFRHFNRHQQALGVTKPLLFAPCLMLERGLQFTERRSLTSNDA